MTGPAALPAWLRAAFDDLYVATADLASAAQAADADAIARVLEGRGACLSTLERCVARFRAEAGASAEPLLAREGQRLARAAEQARDALAGLMQASRVAIEEAASQGAAARGYTTSAVSRGGFERSS